MKLSTEELQKIDKHFRTLPVLAQIVIDPLLKHIKELEREIEVLRQYGNKDCTAMADEALKGDR